MTNDQMTNDQMTNDQMTKWPMTNDQMTNDQWPMTNDQWPMTNDQMTNDRWPMTVNKGSLNSNFVGPVFSTIPTNRGAPFFAYKHLQPTIHQIALTKGLTLETSALKLFTVANLRYQLNL